MILPVTSDTIIAAATAWQAAPLSILRLSGASACELAGGVLEDPWPAGAPAPAFVETRVRIGEVRLPAVAYRFRAPRSYTGQDVVEIHTIGCLPLVRQLAEELIRRGARRALPGEFTARAFLNGKLGADQVDGVHALIRAVDAADARAAARRVRGADARRRQAVVESLRDLLARIEAGIDFVDEEDVRFVTGEEAGAILRGAIEALGDQSSVGNSRSAVSAHPRVVLAGRPNAGKSTLFNALVGSERVIVSPILGTTRDVVSADVEIDGRRMTLVDTAGVADDADPLGRAVQRASRASVETAELVIWVHAANEAWTADELSALSLVDAERRMVVESKCELPRASERPESLQALAISVARDVGLGDLRLALAARLARLIPAREPLLEVAEALGGLRRALALLPSLAGCPELLSLEIRSVLAVLDDMSFFVSVDETLGRIFRRFCVGK